MLVKGAPALQLARYMGYILLFPKRTIASHFQLLNCLPCRTGCRWRTVDGRTSIAAAKSRWFFCPYLSWHVQNSVLTNLFHKDVCVYVSEKFQSGASYWRNATERSWSAVITGLRLLINPFWKTTRVVVVRKRWTWKMIISIFISLCMDS